MSRQGYEFGFWAILTVGIATMIIMWQHMTHTQFIVSQMGLGVAPARTVVDAPQAVAATVMAGPPDSPSTATGIWAPTGPTEFSGPFLYNPPQRLQ